jgi:ABC-type multidrug transport system fused ATPase/permease subunit
LIDDPLREKSSVIFTCQKCGKITKLMTMLLLLLLLMMMMMIIMVWIPRRSRSSIHQQRTRIWFNGELRAAAMEAAELKRIVNSSVQFIPAQLHRALIASRKQESRSSAEFGKHGFRNSAPLLLLLLMRMMMIIIIITARKPSCRLS